MRRCSEAENLRKLKLTALWALQCHIELLVLQVNIVAFRIQSEIERAKLPFIKYVI
jgi:hypothetical protein